MNKIITENINENTKDIDLISTFDIVRKINEEDKKVALAVEVELKNIANAVDLISKSFLKGGSLFYFGAGTSGRLGVLDASECPPTFGADYKMVQGIIAGGDRALRYAIEGAEDNYELGLKDGDILSKKDCAVLISASGNPKYLLGVSKKAKEKGAKIIALTSNPKAKIIENADIKICTVVGAEAIAGSSRMKSGSAQKMVLNMLTTASMVKIGKTFENYMIDVKTTNEKLKRRAVSIVSKISNKDENISQKALEDCSWDVKTAVLYLLGIPKDEIKALLNENNGVLRRVFQKRAL